jgi:hypothetical protein
VNSIIKRSALICLCQNLKAPTVQPTHDTPFEKARALSVELLNRAAHRRTV